MIARLTESAVRLCVRGCVRRAYGELVGPSAEVLTDVLVGELNALSHRLHQRTMQTSSIELRLGYFHFHQLAQRAAHAVGSVGYKLSDRATEAGPAASQK